MAEIDPALVQALMGAQPELSDRMINYHLNRGQPGLNKLMGMVGSDADAVALARQMAARGLSVPAELVPKEALQQMQARALFGGPATPPGVAPQAPGGTLNAKWPWQ